MAKHSTTSDIAAITAALIPDAVKAAFNGQSLTLGDVLSLEQAGCRFIATGAPPSVREMSILFWMISDKEGFASALASGDFEEALHVYASSKSPAVIPAAAAGIKGVLSRSFNPGGEPGKAMPTPMV